MDPSDQLIAYLTTLQLPQLSKAEAEEAILVARAAKAGLIEASLERHHRADSIQIHLQLSRTAGQNRR